MQKVETMVRRGVCAVGSQNPESLNIGCVTDFCCVLSFDLVGRNGIKSFEVCPRAFCNACVPIVPWKTVLD